MKKLLSVGISAAYQYQLFRNFYVTINPNR